KINDLGFRLKPRPGAGPDHRPAGGVQLGAVADHAFDVCVRHVAEHAAGSDAAVSAAVPASWRRVRWRSKRTLPMWATAKAPPIQAVPASPSLVPMTMPETRGATAMPTLKAATVTAPPSVFVSPRMEKTLALTAGVTPKMVAPMSTTSTIVAQATCAVIASA